MMQFSSSPGPRLPSRRARSVGLVLAVCLLAASALAGPLASADEIAELRDGIPPGSEVREQIADLSAQRDELLTALSAAEGDLTDALEERDALDEDQRRLAAQIEAATDHLRTVAVRAFVSGGDVGELQFLVSVDSVSDLSWRRHLLRNHAGSSHAALVRLDELNEQATDEVRESIETADRLRTEIGRLEIEIAAIEPQIVEARSLELVADAWDRAAIAIEEGRYGIAPADKWAKLRFCESSDNYQAISPSGTYRGAYQFDHATWQTVGGTGDPAAASPAEQDARARELYARRGAQPWECGYHLR